MSTLTATLLKKMLATAEGDCKELEKAVELHPTETEDQLLNLRSLLRSFSKHCEALRSALREFE
jgi:ferritin-like metal-binding protein YciE